MSRIFINYRREDTGMGVGRLTDSLREHFAHDQIFQDISSIDPGADFIEALQQALADCAAVLVVIGPKWLSVADRQGRRRLDDPDDWVRQEIVEALGRPGLRVFPLLVDGAEMPAGEELPDAIRPLARRQAYELTLRHWAKDIAVLIETLKRIPSLPTEGKLPEGAATLAGAAKFSQQSDTSPSPTTEEPLPEVSALPAERQDASQQPGESLPQTETGGDGNGRPESSSALKRFTLAGVALAVGFSIWFFPGKKPEPPVVDSHVVEVPQKPVPEPKPSSTSFTDVMVSIPAGCFEMGSPPGEKGRVNNERQHRVCVETFAIGKTEVTQAQWQSVMGNNPSSLKCAECPVEQVSWTDAMAFITKLNAITRLRYRLPTEAEWEYACRGGRPGERFCGGDNLDSVAWTKSNSLGHTHQVGQKPANGNGFGLKDMSGNVWEWTCSGYDGDYQGGEGQCANQSSRYSLRGGGWNDDQHLARLAHRGAGGAGDSLHDLGFRLARTLQ